MKEGREREKLYDGSEVMAVVVMVNAIRTVRGPFHFIGGGILFIAEILFFVLLFLSLRTSS